MLTGVDDSRLELSGSAPQFLDHHRQFDGFRPGAKNRDNSTLHRFPTCAFGHA
jgi:hypothetical protein